MPGYTDSNGYYHPFRKSLGVSLFDFRLGSAGDVANAAANGGILATDTAPTLTGVSTGYGQRITWIANGVIQILCQFSLPEDFDGREDVLVELWVSSGGTSDLSSFSVLTSWDGGSTVTDTATDTGASTTVHKITARVAAADIPNEAFSLSMALVPAAHATDTMLLDNVRILYVPRVVSNP